MGKYTDLCGLEDDNVFNVYLEILKVLKQIEINTRK